MGLDRIVIDKEILAGKPIIKGTRISVALILDLVSAGMSIDEIIESYPHLTKEDILSAIEYAARRIEDEDVMPLKGKEGCIIRGYLEG